MGGNLEKFGRRNRLLTYSSSLEHALPKSTYGSLDL